MIDPVVGKRVVILTGCSSGIGLQTSLLFLKHGYKVLGLDINQFDSSHVDKLEGGKYKENFQFYQANLLEEGVVDKAVAACIEKFGQVDVLVNNAGVLDTYSSAHNYTDKEYNRIMGINFTAPLSLMRAVLPHMLAAKKGRIVNICSIASTSGGSAGITYTASKHALLGATKHAAFRYKHQGITANAILPGFVTTNLWDGVSAPIDKESYAVCEPVLNLQGPEFAADPEEIGRAVLFLASEGSGAISGASLAVDRAWSTV